MSDYLDVLRAHQGRAPRPSARGVATTVMERTHIADMANRHCAKLSKGYRQRVGLAQALLHNPDVLILDEPTAGLDPKQIIETRRLIKGLGGDHTVILSTHILPEVSQTCNRIVIINRGRVVAVDTPDNLTARCCAGRRRCTCRWTPWVPTRRNVVVGPGRDPCHGVDRRDGIAGYEVESEAAATCAGAGVHCRRPRLGSAGAATDANEPGRDLPAGHHRRSGRGQPDAAAEASHE